MDGDYDKGPTKIELGRHVLRTSGGRWSPLSVRGGGFPSYWPADCSPSQEML
jgi:hypothetical protein